MYAPLQAKAIVSHTFLQDHVGSVWRFTSKKLRSLILLPKEFPSHDFLMTTGTIRYPFQVYKISNWLFKKYSFLTHTSIFQFVLHNFDNGCFDQCGQRGFLSPGHTPRRVCLPNREMLVPAAAPRGYHFEIIIGIQFGFVNMDRALLHLDSWACLMWSSACQPVSSIFVTQTPEPHYSWQKGQSFFTERTDFFPLPRCLFPVRGKFHDTLSPARPCGSPPLPQQTTSGLGLGWISSGLYPWLCALRSVWPSSHRCNYANLKRSHVINTQLCAPLPKDFEEFEFEPVLFSLWLLTGEYRDICDSELICLLVLFLIVIFKSELGFKLRATF